MDVWKIKSCQNKYWGIVPGILGDQDLLLDKNYGYFRVLILQNYIYVEFIGQLSGNRKSKPESPWQVSPRGEYAQISGEAQGLLIKWTVLTESDNVTGWSRNKRAMSFLKEDPQRLMLSATRQGYSSSRTYLPPTIFPSYVGKGGLRTGLYHCYYHQ
ncbi:unnamed protein product [Allacma fusca]|uniref:Uncharacterized protein n=1 Tax=Allacma fusca TaxID=39272 RepID=A0A8J2PI52_9HEXA|nr:unnamed protein product [Allacma fusca]